MESAFLKCVTDDPDDTTARLVFADWLREQDAPALNERGEFIHTQLLLARDVPRDQRPGLVARQKELLERHRERWEIPFRDLIGGTEYRGGFAERVTLRAEQFVDYFEALAKHTPVVRVRLSGLNADTVSFVAETPALGQVRELDLNRQPVPPAVLSELLASPHLGRLRYLNLVRTGVGDAGLRALVTSKVFRNLRYLNLSHADVSAAGVRTLTNAIYNAPKLEVLVLRGAPRLDPSTFPPLPARLPLRLRQSLEAQICRGREPEQSLLIRLHEDRATLPNDFRRLVEWLHTHGAMKLPHGVGTVPLPDPVREAFARVCERRVVWRAERSALELPALPLDDAGRTNLAEAIRVLLRISGLAAGGSVKESHALADCLLDLYLRHERDELPADGRTR